MCSGVFSQLKQSMSAAPTTMIPPIVVIFFQMCARFDRPRFRSFMDLIFEEWANLKIMHDSEWTNFEELWYISCIFHLPIKSIVSSKTATIHQETPKYIPMVRLIYHPIRPVGSHYMGMGQRRRWIAFLEPCAISHKGFKAQITPFEPKL